METEARASSREPGARSGIDRRTLIKRAAVAGAVAWTAPVIIDSFASPAAAQTTGPQGCSQACFNSSCSFNQTSLCNFPGCAAGSNAQAAACLQITGACDEGGDTTVTVIGGCTSCTITGYNFNDPGGTCNFVTVTPAKTITFDIPDEFNSVNQICVRLQCG